MPRENLHDGKKGSPGGMIDYIGAGFWRYHVPETSNRRGPARDGDSSAMSIRRNKGDF